MPNASPVPIPGDKRKGEKAHRSSSTRTTGNSFGELVSEPLNVKGNRRKQIEADGNAARGGPDQGNRYVAGVSRDPCHDFLNRGQACQGHNIEAQVHDLNQKKQDSHVALRHPWQIFRPGQNRGRRRRVLHRGAEVRFAWSLRCQPFPHDLRPLLLRAENGSHALPESR